MQQPVWNNVFKRKKKKKKKKVNWVSEEIANDIKRTIGGLENIHSVENLKEESFPSQTRSEGSHKNLRINKCCIKNKILWLRLWQAWFQGSVQLYRHKCLKPFQMFQCMWYISTRLSTRLQIRCRTYRRQELSGDRVSRFQGMWGSRRQWCWNSKTELWKSFF